MISLRPSEQLVGLGLALLLLWTYWTSLAEVTHRWRADPTYSHGYFVPLFAAWLLWRQHRQREKVAEPLTGSWWGLPLLMGGMACHLVGIYFFIEWLSEAALLPSLAGFCVCLGGWSLARLAGPSIAFLAFMLPLPYRAEVALANPLQELATVSSTFLLQMLGLTASSEGNTIVMDEGVIGVVDACSGLGMLVTFVALATGVAIVLERPLLDKLIVVGGALPVALISNVVRITGTGLLFEIVGGQKALIFYHDVAGWLMMPFALALIWVELKILSGLLLETPAEAPEAIGLALGLTPAPPIPRVQKGGVKSRVCL